jgi:hypothetical protein
MYKFLKFKNPRNAGRKLKFSEKTTVISVRVPVSKAAYIKRVIKYIIENQKQTEQ